MKSKRDQIVAAAAKVFREKGLVTRDESARSHVYAAAVPEHRVKRHLVRDMVERVFEGSAADLVLQALSSQKTSKDEIEQIRNLLDRHSRGER